MDVNTLREQLGKQCLELEVVMEVHGEQVPVTHIGLTRSGKVVLCGPAPSGD